MTAGFLLQIKKNIRQEEINTKVILTTAVTFCQAALARLDGGSGAGVTGCITWTTPLLGSCTAGDCALCPLWPGRPAIVTTYGWKKCGKAVKHFVWPLSVLYFDNQCTVWVKCSSESTFRNSFRITGTCQAKEGPDYLLKHTGQHSPSTNEGLAQATGGHVIWWHTILDSCHQWKILRFITDINGQYCACFYSCAIPGRYIWCSCPQPSPPYRQRDVRPASTYFSLLCSLSSQIAPSSWCSPLSGCIKQIFAEKND